MVGSACPGAQLINENIVEAAAAVNPSTVMRRMKSLRDTSACR